MCVWWTSVCFFFFICFIFIFFFFFFKQKTAYEIYQCDWSSDVCSSDLRSRKIRLEIFRDRLVVSSPGYPPRPLTLAKLRRGKYESCRRNPVIAECLASLDMMEQRGTGFERIRAAMQDHGLDAHKLDQRDGYFKVILPGPDGDFDRLRTPTDARGLVPPSVEAELNERQKQILVRVQVEGKITSGWCRKTFDVTYDTAYRDLSNLVKRGLLVQRGRGRSTRYEINIEGL